MDEVTNDLAVGPRKQEYSVDLAAAVNDRAVLAACLERSPDLIAGDARLRIYEGFGTASEAYNAALSDTDADCLVLVHQDVYLPQGFLARLRRWISQLDSIDPDWAVAGVIGVDGLGAVVGETWSSGLECLIGRRVATPSAVVALDEMLLVVRPAVAPRFDPALPSFHLYGTDIVQSAKVSGRSSYVIDLPVIHHSRPTVDLRGSYRRAYQFMQRKWRRQLPIPTLVCPIHRSSVPFWVRQARMQFKARGSTARREPQGDPAQIARRLGME